MAVTRRFFLKSSGLAMVSLASAPSFLRRTALGETRGGRGSDSPILIAIFQRGAVDGISMVVPFGDKNYYSYRPQIAIPEPGRSSQDGTIDLDGFFGLHPALAPFKPLYDSKNLAIVHAVGSPDNTRSHFDAQDYMESGTPGNKGTGDGWLNRFMQFFETVLSLTESFATICRLSFGHLRHRHRSRRPRPFSKQS